MLMIAGNIIKFTFVYVIIHMHCLIPSLLTKQSMEQQNICLFFHTRAVTKVKQVKVHVNYSRNSISFQCYVLI